MSAAVEMWFMVGFAIAQAPDDGWFSKGGTRANHTIVGTEPFYRTREECEAAAKSGAFDRLSSKVTKFGVMCVPGWVVDR